jgi:hypothetical protein
MCDICFKIYAGARVTQGIESHIFYVGSDLIKFGALGLVAS